MKTFKNKYIRRGKGLQINRNITDTRGQGAQRDVFHQTVLPAGAGDHEQVTFLQLLSRDRDCPEDREGAHRHPGGAGGDSGK